MAASPIAARATIWARANSARSEKVTWVSGHDNERLSNKQPRVSSAKLQPPGATPEPKVTNKVCLLQPHLRGIALSFPLALRHLPVSFPIPACGGSGRVKPRNNCFAPVSSTADERPDGFPPRAAGDIVRTSTVRTVPEQNRLLYIGEQSVRVRTWARAKQNTYVYCESTGTA